MRADEPLDMGVMLECLKIAERLEYWSRRLRNVGRNKRVIEPPSLEALETLPPGTKHLEPGAEPVPLAGGDENVVPIGLELDDARHELRHLAIRAEGLWTKWANGQELEAQ